MADRIYLSCWLRGFTQHNMLASFEKVLRKFPYSRLAPVVTLRVYAVEFTEPPQMEEHFENEIHPGQIIARCREWENADCAYQVETSWDLWLYDHGSWQLAPTTITFTCFGPLFPSELGEQLLVEFGLDSKFLPQPGLEGGTVPVRSNIRSLLHLVQDIAKSLPLEKKTLWSESGENLAEELQRALE
ncbi:MAG: hypothetical protein U0Q16_07960 [Bryobacteraceae bacterium]